MIEVIQYQKLQYMLFLAFTVADLEGVGVVRLNPLGPNYFNFMGKFMINLVKC